MLINRLTGQKLNLSQLSGLIAASLVLLTGLLISLFTWSHLKDQLSLKLYQDAQLQLQRLTMTIAPSLLQQDRVSINVTLQEWTRGPDLTAIRVFNNNQQIIAEIGRTQPNTTEITQPVTQDNIVIGVLRADISVAMAYTAAARYLGMSLLQTALLALLVGFLIYALCERYLSYFQQVQSALAKWLSKETALPQLPAKPALNDFKELHATLTLWSNQAEKFNAIEHSINRFIARKSAAADSSMRYQDCFILLIDLQNLEQLTAQLNTTELTQRLDAYHRVLSKAAKLYNARLEPYFGNSIAMLFPVDHETSSEQRKNEALHCLWSASLLQGMLKQINHQTPELQVRMGVHFGAILQTHHNDHGQYCKIAGDTMQWAAHLTSKSEADAILASDNMRDFFIDDFDFAWLSGPTIPDFHGMDQASWWLESLGEKNQSLINRQVHHLSTLAETQT